MSQHQTPAEYLMDFLLSRIEEQPAEQRIMLYRALAAETKDRLVANTCRNLADRLEEIQHAHEQLQLNLRAISHGVGEPPRSGS